MRVTILAIGRQRDAALAGLIEDYRRRCAWPVAIVECQPKKGESEAQRLARALPPGAAILALDCAGELASSQALAARLAAWRDGGRDVACLIGGADGLGGDLLARADWCLALGRLTWPHLLVRLLLMEQLYRAGTILAGHPYHRGGLG